MKDFAQKYSALSGQRQRTGPTTLWLWAQYQTTCPHTFTKTKSDCYNAHSQTLINGSVNTFKYQIYYNKEKDDSKLQCFFY